MQLIIKNGKVVAIHADHQDVAHKYPGAECILWPTSVDPMSDDPRTEIQKGNTYKDLRRLSYPPVAEQLDMMYHDKVNSTTTWLDAIDAIKITYPKPAKE